MKVSAGLHAPQKTPWEKRPLPLPTSVGSGRSLACGRLTPVSAPRATWPSPPLRISPLCVSYKDPCRVFRAHPDNPKWSLCEIPNLITSAKTLGHIGEEKHLFLQPFWILSWGPWQINRDRVTKEKHENLFNISFVWHRRLQESEDPNKQSIPGLLKSGELWENGTGHGYELRVINRGRLSRACSFRFLSSSLHPCSFPPGIRRAPLTWVSCDLLPGKFRESFLQPASS